MENDKKKTNKSNTKYIVIIIITILIIIGLCIFYFISKNNSLGQVQQFEQAVNKDDYKQITSMLSNNDHKFTDNDSKHFIDYVKRKDNKLRFKDEITKIKETIKNSENHNVELGTITDINNKKIITLRKNGKHLLFLNEIKFEPHFFNIYVKEYDNSATYIFKNDKSYKTYAENNNYSKIGEFFVGDYNISTKKNIKDTLLDDEMNGQIYINTDKSDKDRNVIAKDYFNQSWFKTKINNDNKLDNNSLKISIENKKVEYKNNKIYGKYPNDSTIKVNAIGTLEGKIFKTNSILVAKNYKNKPQIINLSFNETEIDDYMIKSKKIKNKSKRFLKNYIDDLNKAYKKENYKYLSIYL